MRLILCTAAVLASTVAFAQQGPSSYVLTVSPDEANTVLVQLGKMDWAAVNPLMQKIIAQLKAQNAVSAPTEAPPKDPPK